MCLRVTLVNFFNWIVDNGLFDVVKITIPPYDEVNCEAPVEIADEVALKLHEIMKKAGAYFCTRCVLDADLSRLKLCVKNFEYKGKFLMFEGDALAPWGEDALYNVTRDIIFDTKSLPKELKDCLKDEGPLPSFWVH